MLVTNHVLCGALIGVVVRRPLPAFGLGVASHFALDAIPHWGNWRDSRQFLQVATADGLTGLAVMAALAAGSPGRRAAVTAGMAGAALPDIDKPTLEWFGVSPFPRFVSRFHSGIQDEALDRWRREAACAAVFAAAALAVLRARAAAHRPHEPQGISGSPEAPGPHGPPEPASRSRAARMRFSDTGAAVPSVWANRLTRSSSIIQRIASTSGLARRAGGSACTASR